MKTSLTPDSRDGSSMLIVLMVIASLSACIIAALNFTSAVSRNVQRSILRALVDRYLADAPARAERAARGRAAVLARHTFGHRVATIVEIVDPILAGRASRIVEAPGVTPPTGSPTAG